jgi:hypothetical protein
MVRKFLLATGLLVISLASHAGVISHYGYERDDASNIVTGNGLEWLQWDVTKGMSIDSTLQSYSIDGWKLASNQQMAGLFNAFGFGKSDWTDSESSFQSSATPWTPDESSPHNAFLELFGVTFESSCSPSQIIFCNDPSDRFRASRAYYGSDADRDLMFNFAHVVDDYTTLAESDLRRDHYAGLSFDSTHLVEYSLYAGVALVREVQMPVHNVSEPYTFSLLAFALIALGFRRRQALRP